MISVIASSMCRVW